MAWSTFLFPGPPRPARRVVSRCAKPIGVRTGLLVILASVGASALSAPAAVAQAGRLEISGAPASLNRELQRLIPEETEPQSLFEANRQARRAASILSQLLESEGYYAARVTPFAEDGAGLRRGVRVEAGGLFTIGSSAISYLGPPPEDDVLATLSTLLEGVATGAPARAAPILATEDALLRRLSGAGYADASADPVDALADGELQTLDLTFRLKAGPKVTLGPVRIAGAQRTRTEFIENMIPWTAGDTYSPERLEELRRRLGETGLFSAASVQLEPAKADASSDPVARGVEVELVEARNRTFTFGGSASTSEGLGVNAGWELRNVRGRGETFAIEGVAANLQRRLETSLSRPNFGHYGRRLRVSARIEDVETDAYLQTGGGVSAEVEDQITGRLRASLAIEAGYSQISNPQVLPLGASRRNVTSLGAVVAAEYTGVRDVLDPTNGVRARIAIEPALIKDGSLIGLTRLTGEASIYSDLGSPKLVGAARVRIGSLTGANGAPPDRLFFAGGGGSVRGYEHQSLSPALRRVCRAGDRLPSSAWRRDGGQASASVLWRLSTPALQDRARIRRLTICGRAPASACDTMQVSAPCVRTSQFLSTVGPAMRAFRCTYRSDRHSDGVSSLTPAYPAPRAYGRPGADHGSYWIRSSRAHLDHFR